ncbi:Polysulphide reductase, NrfD [Candidatus Koribacter versatilis Ellin345]|uniref:Polysulphide reductase, NrfD n=1 Tax=Koribacter versatilis (strain Ellin345) TaxID=204669 RepID=Q1IMF6_KORVE|nr:NrfD/PsrC family molybdoenzyme membrane anchor subunit [Candidatus Koribacter versatilis]ABF41944.1 Polysulphide reductase, NrfD [Candidatus Koribacter versatilis Ellin345]
MMTEKLPRISIWRVLTLLIFIAGAYATYLRFAAGLHGSSNLSDGMPWGMWVGFGTLCGVGLSAGAFALSGAVYVLGMERYRPIVRTAVLLGFLGYCSVCVGYFYELGLPWRCWHILIYWNHNSMLFDVALCVATYTTVLTLEFCPALIEKIPWRKTRELVLHWHHRVTVGVVMAGVLLSSMHQSFLGGLFLIAPGKLYPLWYTHNIHALFFLSAIAGGLAMTVIALHLSMRSLDARIDYSILRELGRVISLLLLVYVIFRGLDLIHTGGARYLFLPVRETAFFWLEVSLLAIIPLILLQFNKIVNTPMYLYWTCCMVVAGFVVNRLNVCITAFERSMNTLYTPKWSELATTLLMIAGCVVAFRYAVLYLDIMPRIKRVMKPERWLSDNGAVARA